MKEFGDTECTGISSEVVRGIYEISDLSMEAKWLWVLISCGYEDFSLTDPHYLKAFEELHSKRHLNYDIAF